MAGTRNNSPALYFVWSGGKLLARDIHDEYTDLLPQYYVCADIVVKNGEISNGTITESIKDWADIEERSFTLKEDGQHTYYRLLIPRANYYVQYGLNRHSIFYYKHKFYYSGEQEGTIKLWQCTEIPLKDLYEFIKNLDNQDDNRSLTCEYNIVSCELLKKAFISAQDAYNKSKSFTGKYSADKRQLRDVLMAAILAFTEYRDQDRLGEASALIESLEASNCLNLATKQGTGVTLCGCARVTDNVDIEYINEITDDDLQYKGV